MIYLLEINSSNVKTSIINSTCAKLKPLKIICLPVAEIEMEVTHTSVALAEKNRWGQTSRSYGKDSMQDLSCKIPKDPNEDMEEIDIEAKLLEIELRQQRKRERAGRKIPTYHLATSLFLKPISGERHQKPCEAQKSKV